MPERRAAGQAPGRVNLIGEHTDYNQGLVLPMAIPQRTRVQLTARDDDRAQLHSADTEPATASYLVGQESKTGLWIDYLQGITWALRQEGMTVTGFEAEVDSDVPVGSGLSSSAALLIGFLRAVRELWSFSLDDHKMIQLAHRAETEFVGVPVGLLDHMACTFADESHALFIDMRTLQSERIALPAGLGILVVDSGERHEHGAGPYRLRRSECERAAAMLSVPSLRDVGEEDLTKIALLPEPLAARAKHVVTENARVLDAVAALREGDLARLGRLFDESHASMRDDFECSTPGIDKLVARIRERDGVLGVRLTGGGFGGAVVVAARSERVSALAEDIARFGPNEQGHRAIVLATIALD